MFKNLEARVAQQSKEESRGREMQEGRDMGTYCICITDSLCYKAEANTPL